VPFTLVYAGKYRTKDKLRDTLQKLNTIQKKQTTQNTAKQNYPGLVTSYDTRPGNEILNIRTALKVDEITNATVLSELSCRCK